MRKEVKVGGCLLMLLVARIALGCTMHRTPVTQFDSEEYVLAGEVVGFIGPQNLKGVDGEAWGVLVKADASVNSPKTPHLFEVFEFQLMADCSLLGMSYERLSNEYRLGAKVLVIAKESKFDVPGPGNVRLVIAPATNGLLSPIGSLEDQFSPTSVYDYRAHTKAPVVRHIFEIRKDLLRLREATSEEEKEGVLRRLVYFPDTRFLEFEEIVRLHLKNKRVGAQLIAQREAWKRQLNKSLNKTDH